MISTNKNGIIRWSGPIFWLLSICPCFMSEVQHIFTVICFSQSHRTANIKDGCIKVNGRDRNISQFRKLSAYIMQDNQLHGNLTVEEAMTVATNLKLSPKVDKNEKNFVVSLLVALIPKTELGPLWRRNWFIYITNGTVLLHAMNKWSTIYVYVKWNSRKKTRESVKITAEMINAAGARYEKEKSVWHQRIF